MVLKEDLLCQQYPSDNLISKDGRRHHRTCIAPAHWQLRALVGVDKSKQRENYLYYPVGIKSQQIQRYNLSTHEASTFRLLSFAPRCLVVKNGWICCGGEHGEYVGISLDETDTLADNETDLADPSLSPSFNADPNVDYQPGFLAILNRHRITNKNILARSTKFGSDRINCVTMWFPPSPGRAFAGAYLEPVSILANNDATVTVVSIRRSERMDKVISYPGSMNRAVLSPDGQLLIAIGDDPYLYAHKRVEGESEPSSEDSAEAEDGKSYVWKQCAFIKLKGQRGEDKSEYRGSFAACFNNTGDILAVGTQYGMICVFSTQAILEGNSRSAMLTCFASTAPKSGPGAIRDMSFCPGAFDLLAWTEDRATVCVTDLRANFTTRQVLKVTDESTFEHVSVQDQNTIDPRLLRDPGTDRPESLSSTNRSNARNMSHFERLIAERIREDAFDATIAGPDDPNRREWPTSNERATPNERERYDYPLTADETQVLEALQEHRRRRERRERRELPDINSVQEFIGSTLRPNRPDEFSTSRTPWDNVRTRTPGATRGALGQSPIGPITSRARASSVTRNTNSSTSARERSASVTRAVDDILGNNDTIRANLRNTNRIRQDANNSSERLRQAASSQAARLQAMQDRMRERIGIGPAPRSFDSNDILNHNRDPRARYFQRRGPAASADDEPEDLPDLLDNPTSPTRRARGPNLWDVSTERRWLRPPRRSPPTAQHLSTEGADAEDAEEDRAHWLGMIDLGGSTSNTTGTLAYNIGPNRVVVNTRPAGEGPPPGTTTRRGEEAIANRPPGTSAWDAISSLYSLTLDSDGNITQTRDGAAADSEYADGDRRDAMSLFNLVGQLRDSEARHSNLQDATSGYRARMRAYEAWGTRTSQERDETAGLAWSEDGRTLFVGAFDGIYEFPVNTYARRIFPSITMS